MKKKLMAAVLAGLMAMSLLACGGSFSSGSAEPAKEEAAEAEAGAETEAEAPAGASQLRLTSLPLTLASRLVTGSRERMTLVGGNWMSSTQAQSLPPLTL